jgi:hypothetical protein
MYNKKSESFVKRVISINKSIALLMLICVMLVLTGCGPKRINGFFSDEILEKYGLVNMPKPNTIEEGYYEVLMNSPSYTGQIEKDNFIEYGQILFDYLNLRFNVFQSTGISLGNGKGYVTNYEQAKVIEYEIMEGTVGYNFHLTKKNIQIYEGENFVEIFRIALDYIPGKGNSKVFQMSLLMMDQAYLYYKNIFE